MLLCCLIHCLGYCVKHEYIVLNCHLSLFKKSRTVRRISYEATVFR